MGIITGHNNLSCFQFKIDPDVNPMCRFFEEEIETFHHFITTCPRLRQLRQNNIRHYETYDWKINEMLTFSQTREINDYLEKKDYLVYGNSVNLVANYSTDSTS